jgi:hypothetical protein
MGRSVGVASRRSRARGVRDADGASHDDADFGDADGGARF